jgi:transposase
MFYGIDLHRDNFEAAVLGDKDGEPKKFRCSINSPAFKKFLQTLTKEDYLVVEATVNTFWFIEKVEEKVKECYVIDPWKFLTISNADKKTDKIDAVKLARKLKYYILCERSDDEFPRVYIPSKEVRELRSLFTTYDFYKREVSAYKNRISSLFRENGICVKGNKDINHIDQKLLDSFSGLYGLPETVKCQIMILQATLKQLIETKEQVKQKILVSGSIFMKEIRLLTSIKGITPFTVIAIMSEIGEISRFKNSKKFCSYLRAGQKIDSSNLKKRVGSLCKRSRKLVMTLLMQSVNHFRNSSKKMNSFYEKKIGGKSPGKVRVAVARKTLVIIYYMLTRNKEYYYVDKKNYQSKIAEYERSLNKAA